MATAPPVTPSSAVSGGVPDATSEPKGLVESVGSTAVTDSGVASLSASAAAPAAMPSAPPKDPADSLPPAVKRNDHGAALRAVPPASALPAPVDHAAPAAVETGSVEDYVAAKLVHAVKPVSPSDALRNYITGNVTVDALVDATGHVKSVAVLSGPLKLRETAIEEMKQYVYEPARRNGRAVTSHVQASLQFWYEP